MQQSSADWQYQTPTLEGTDAKAHAPTIFEMQICQEYKTFLLQVVGHLKVASRSTILMSCRLSKNWSQGPGSMSGPTWKDVGMPSTWSALVPGTALPSGMVPAVKRGVTARSFRPKFWCLSRMCTQGSHSGDGETAWPSGRVPSVRTTQS